MARTAATSASSTEPMCMRAAGAGEQAVERPVGLEAAATAASICSSTVTSATT